MKHRKHHGTLATAVAMTVAAILLGCRPPDASPPVGGGSGPDPVAKIFVSHDGVQIGQGGVVDLGLAVVSASRRCSFGIENLGSDTLHLTGQPFIAKSGSDSDCIVVVADPVSTLSPGESTTFAIVLTAASAGDLSALLTIECDDPLDSSYSFGVTATVIEPPAKTPATGQTTAFSAGDDGDLQAGVSWPADRFASNADGTTTDTLTGLMWETTPGGTSRQWDNALSYANNLALGGHTDWRLANVNELMSLVNAGAANPASWLNGDDGLSGVRADKYWTSNTSYSSTTLWGWVVHMNTGVLARQNISAYGAFAYAWAVRDAGGGAASTARTGNTFRYRTGDDGDLQAGAAWPSPRFIDNQDGTVTDSLTGLVWAEEPVATMMAWEAALAHANALDHAGYTDWRLPNRCELRSLVSYGTTYNDSRLSSGFGGTVPAGEYWTSSTYAPDTAQAWLVVIETGHSYYEGKTALNYVWAVRGGD